MGEFDAALSYLLMVKAKDKDEVMVDDKENQDKKPSKLWSLGFEVREIMTDNF